jgi:hypothetical protein
MKRIKYASQFASDLGSPEIEDIAARAAARNAALGITGILMSSGRLFFQVIEGPERAIDDLFASIGTDPRHRDVLLLSEETVAERAFPDWAMKKIDLGADADERLAGARRMLEDIIERRRELERRTLTLERAIWYELASALE